MATKPKIEGMVTKKRAEARVDQIVKLCLVIKKVVWCSGY